MKIEKSNKGLSLELNVDFGDGPLKLMFYNPSDMDAAESLAILAFKWGEKSGIKESMKLVVK